MTDKTKPAAQPKPKDISAVLDQSEDDKIIRGGAPTKRGTGGHSPTKNGGRM